MKNGNARAPATRVATVLPDLSGRVAISPAEFCAVLGFSRNKFYAEVRAKRIKILKAGKKTLLDANEPRAYLGRLQSVA